MDIKRLTQCTIEDKYSKAEVNKRIKECIFEDVTMLTIADAMKEAIVNYTDVLGYTYWDSKAARVRILKRKNDINDLIVYIAVGVLKSNGKEVKIHGVVDYIARKLNGFKDFMDAVRTASELLAVCRNCGLYEMVAAKDAEEGVISVQASFTLDDKTTAAIADTMYLPPMICEPKEIKGNFDSAFINKFSESVVLKRYNEHNMPLALDAINIANSIPLAIDKHIYNYEELPAKSLSKDAIKQFIVMREASKKVYDLMLKNGNRFFIPWRFDKRGRMCAQGYHINIQSYDYKKALISFAEEEIVPLD